MTHIDTNRLDETRRPGSPASRVELPPREPSTPSSDDQPSASVHGRQWTPMIALAVSVVAAVLAVIAFAADVVDAPPAGPVLVPDGVPCPNAPARGMVPC